MFRAVLANASKSSLLLGIGPRVQFTPFNSSFPDRLDCDSAPMLVQDAEQEHSLRFRWSLVSAYHEDRSKTRQTRQTRPDAIIVDQDASKEIVG